MPVSTAGSAHHLVVREHHLVHLAVGRSLTRRGRTPIVNRQKVTTCGGDHLALNEGWCSSKSSIAQ